MWRARLLSVDAEHMLRGARFVLGGRSSSTDVRPGGISPDAGRGGRAGCRSGYEVGDGASLVVEEQVRLLATSPLRLVIACDLRKRFGGSWSWTSRPGQRQSPVSMTAYGKIAYFRRTDVTDGNRCRPACHHVEVRTRLIAVAR